MQKVNNVAILGILAAVSAVVVNVLIKAAGEKRQSFFNKIDLFTAVSTGFLNTYLLVRSGRQKKYFKGMAAGLFNYLVYHGIFRDKGKKRDFFALWDWYNMLVHIIAGSFSALFISRIGDDYLFPYELPRAKDEPSFMDKYAYSTQIIRDKFHELKAYQEAQEKAS